MRTIKFLLLFLVIISVTHVAESAHRLKISRGPYLQMNTPGSVTIRWRTSVPTDSVVFYSTDEDSLSNVLSNPALETEHSITIPNLDTGIQYFYRAGSSDGLVQSKKYFFVTPPDNGHPFDQRFMVIGDSGNNRATAKQVRSAYLRFSKDVYTNMVIALGDDAYNSGTDPEFKKKFFGPFKKVLAKSISVSVLGEHDTAGSDNPPPDLPYMQAFNLPHGSGTGGFDSGSEKYYSFNFGNVHIVALDSMTSDRSVSGPMLKWLQQDLDANLRSWIIAIWHHSPYSRGNHNSDVEAEMSEMRQNANQILEDHGVDLVLGAHSNTYERSFLIDGHYGDSSSFSPSMIKNGGDGSLTGNGAYQKQAATVHTGAVYMVLGTTGGAASGQLNYPAMFRSLAQPGAAAIDISCDELTVQYMNQDQVVKDNFTIKKLHQLPTVSITSPNNGADFNAGANITINATAGSTQSHMRRVRFLKNGLAIDTDFAAPYSVQMLNAVPGNYAITAIAEDELCGSKVSQTVNITVH